MQRPWRDSAHRDEGTRPRYCTYATYRAAVASGHGGDNQWARPGFLPEVGPPAAANLARGTRRSWQAQVSSPNIGYLLGCVSATTGQSNSNLLPTESQHRPSTAHLGGEDVWGNRAAAGHHNSVMGVPPRRWCHADGEHRIGRPTSVSSFVAMSSCPTRSFEAKLCCGPRGSFCVMYRSKSKACKVWQVSCFGVGKGVPRCRVEGDRRGYVVNVVRWSAGKVRFSGPLAQF